MAKDRQELCINGGRLVGVRKRLQRLEHFWWSRFRSGIFVQALLAQQPSLVRAPKSRRVELRIASGALGQLRLKAREPQHPDDEMRFKRCAELYLERQESPDEKT